MQKRHFVALGALALGVGAAVGAAAGWAAHAHRRRADWAHLAQRRADEARFAEMAAETEREEQEWWDSLPADKKLRIAMREAEERHLYEDDDPDAEVWQ